MKKRIGALLLTLCMVVSPMLYTASASGDGVFIWDEKHNLVCDCEINEDASGDNWSYDAATQTLTLDNFHGSSINVFCARIVLIGENTLQEVADPDGIGTKLLWSTWLTKDGLGTLEGTGSLTIIGGMNYSSASDLVLNDGLKITGGQTRGDTLPLTVKDGTLATTDGAKARYVRIAPDRATIVTALYRKSGDGYEVGNNPNQKLPYTDISREILPAVWWAKDNNITDGYGDGRFGPNDPVTREQFAVFLYRYAQEKCSRTHDEEKYNLSTRADLSGYTDSGKISNWAKEAMSWANAMGYITGVTDTTLNPSANVTRAEVATILMRAMVL